MLADIKENVVLYDWVTFSTRVHSIATLKQELGLDHVQWTDFPGHGRYGYRDRMEFSSICILYNGRDDMGICLEMSGQGCRSFEDNTSLSLRWNSLIPLLLSPDVNLTRLDVAFDDHTGLLDINRIWDDTLSLNFISRSRCYKAEISGRTDSQIVGKSITFGTRSSMFLTRIYDKAAERGYSDRHWVRVEMQLRDDRAFAFLEYAQSTPIGEAFAGVLLNYLRFVEPDATDSNKSRWCMADYWANLLTGVSRIRLYSAPGGEYNLAKLEHQIFEANGNAISCFVDLFGVESLLDGVKNRKCKPNPKYTLLKNQTIAELERMADAAKLAFETDEIDVPRWGWTSEPVSELVSTYKDGSETLPIFGSNLEYVQVKMEL